MITKIQKAIVGGLLGTVAMTLFMLGAPIIGLPEMSPPRMLSTMLDFPILEGWLMHFIIGIIFAAMYVFVISRILRRIRSTVWEGAIFGVFAFAFGQVMIALLGALFVEAPPIAGSMILTTVESVLGHLIFGVAVAMYVKSSS